LLVYAKCEYRFISLHRRNTAEHTPKLRASPLPTGAWFLPVNQTREVKYYFDQSLASTVVNLAREGEWNSILDVGAGIGRYARFYQDNGLGTFAIDGLNDASARSGRLVNEIDITGNKSWCHRVDVVMVLEVLEHIPVQFETRVLDDIVCSASKRIILSWAHKAQRGNGHVNTRNAADVVRIFEKRAWRVHPNETSLLRRNSTFPWFKANLFSFYKITS
jgi:SAM-dependent methyltransferase